jgi:AI-2 transport protein TqsA
MKNEYNLLISKFAYIIIIVAGLNLASDVILPFLGAFFLFIIFLPIVKIFNKYSVPNVITASIILSIIVFIFFVFISYFISVNENIMNNLDFYQNKFQEISPRIISFFEYFNISLEWDTLITIIEPSNLIKYISSLFGNIGNIILDILLTLFLVMFLLLETNIILDKIHYFFKLDKITNKNTIDIFFNSISRYFLLKTFTSLLTGILIWILLSYFGLTYALFLALVAFILVIPPQTKTSQK